MFGKSKRTSYYTYDVKDIKNIHEIAQAKVNRRYLKKLLRKVPQDKKDAERPNRSILLRNV